MDFNSLKLEESPNISRKISYSELEDADQSQQDSFQCTFKNKGVKGIVKQLKDGNQRFMDDKSINPRRCAEIRKHFVESQNSVVAVLACSDSRAPVEIIFDVGIGDIFVIRSAGHVLSSSGYASIEYAIRVLNISLVVVLGHHNCGAIKATYLATNELKDQFSDSLQDLIDQISPSVKKAKEQHLEKEELLELATDYHIANTIELVHKKLYDVINEKQVTVIGAKYNLGTGKVNFFDSYGYDNNIDLISTSDSFAK